MIINSGSYPKVWTNNMKDSSEHKKKTKIHLEAPEMSTDSPTRQMRSMSIAMAGVRTQPPSQPVSCNNRQRTNSLPNPDYLLSYSGCRDPRTCAVSVRSFTTTRKGVINAGDFVRKSSINSLMFTGSAFPSDDRKSHNKCSLTSFNLPDTKTTPDGDRERTSSITSTDSSSSSGSQKFTTTPSKTTGPAGMSYFRVVIQGDHGVGKTSLARQFSSSDYMGTFDISSSSLDVDLNESTIVPVLLDGEESIMEFIDQSQAYQLDDMNVDAYIVVFALVDRNSYLVATDLVRQLRVNVGTDRPIILVGNKSDIVRNRHVYVEEARTMATTYDCKYLETSAALNHHVDGLLAGTLSLIRRQLLPPGEKNLLPPPTHKTRSRTPSPVSFFNKLFRRNSRASSSCEGIFMQ